MSVFTDFATCVESKHAIGVKLCYAVRIDLVYDL